MHINVEGEHIIDLYGDGRVSRLEQATYTTIPIQIDNMFTFYVYVHDALHKRRR